MGFLRRLRRDPGPPPDDAAQVLDLLAEHGLQALDKQLHLEDLVGDADWLLDQDARTITFGGQRACPAQVLGTATDRPPVWRWAWANESIDAGMADDARTVLAIGERDGIDAFVAADVRLGGDLPAEAFALVAAELVGADAYYRGPYDGGAAFILLRLPPDAPRSVDGDGLRAVRTLTLAPLALPVALDRSAIERYLRWVGLEVTPSTGRSVGADRRGGEVTITYDDLGRFSGLESTIEPPAGPL